MEPGDTVATMLPNSFVAFEAWLGVAWLRAIEVPINNAYLGDMLRYLLNDSQAEVLVISQRFVDRLAGVAAELEHLRTVVVPDAEPGRPLPDLPVRRARPAPRFFDGATPADDLDGPEPLRHRRARSTRRAPPVPRRACSCRGPS